MSSPARAAGHAALTLALSLAAVAPSAAQDDAFDLAEWSTVSPSDGWTFVVGDIAGNARPDVVGYHPSDHGDRTRGTLWVGVNEGTRFRFEEWASFTPADRWVFMLGEFNGDGRLDVVGYQPQNGTLWVFRSTGSRFRPSRWGTVSPADGWTFLVGDFAGDGRDDIVGYHPTDHGDATRGSLWVGTSSGTSFAFAQWASLTPATGWTFLTDQFAGNAADDVVGYHPTDHGDDTHGSLWVGRNTGQRFSFSQWATLSPATGWTFSSGQFAGDGRRDVLGYLNTGDETRHELYVGVNTTHSFDLVRRVRFGHSTWSFQPAQFSGSSRHDAVGYDAVHRQLWVFNNTEDDGDWYFEKWAELGEGSWSFAAGNFVGPAERDVMVYDSLTGRVSVGDNRQPLRGFAWPLSAAPGGTIEFYVTGRGSDEAVIVRHRVAADGPEAEEMTRVSFAPRVQVLGEEPWSNGQPWETSFTLEIPGGWRSGIYSAVLTDRHGTERHATFIVRPPAGAREGVAVLANVNTWLAYNTDGGRGKYSGESHVSFLRPNAKTSPVLNNFDGRHLTNGELLLLTWLEDAAGGNLTPDVYTDIDFHSGLVHDRGYHTLVIGTHPEYWTIEMYDNLKAFLRRGGSILYLGGNGVYEKGTYNADGTGMVFFGGADARERRTDQLFRMDARRSERSIFGVHTARCKVRGGPYVVNAAELDHPLLAGTGLRAGDDFGTAFVPADDIPGDDRDDTVFFRGASGLEVDTSLDPESQAADLENSCGDYDPALTSPELVYPDSPRPSNLHWLGYGRHSDGVGAELVSWDHQCGGLILSAGSITFGGSLAVDTELQQIVRNALETARQRVPNLECQLP
jgi:hypothetical protein